MESMSSAEEGEDFVKERKESFLDRFRQHPKQLWNKQSIYRIPCSMRDLNQKAYQPRVVSIGPYHNGNQHLEAMEEHKDRALRHFLSRAYDIRLDDLVGHFRDDEFREKVMNSYSKPIDPQWWDSYASTHLMVLDGCFVLELLLSATTHTCSADSPVSKWCYDANDPIFGAHAERHGIVPYVKLDMLLVENQIPLIILERLAGIAHLGEVNLNDLIRSFYGCRHEVQAMDPLGLHVLDVYRKGRLFPGEYTGWTVPKSAKELDDHGIRFQRSPGGGSGDGVVGIGGFKDVAFITAKKRDIVGKLNDETPASLSRRVFFPLWVVHGDFYLPFLTIDEATEPILLNLMAFERLHLGKEGRDMAVTHYVFLMSRLVRSEEDVRCLRKNSILSSLPERSDEAVVKLFADVTRNVVADDGRGVGTVNQEVRELCGRRPNRWQATWVLHFGSDLRLWVFMLLITYTYTFGLINVVMNILRYIK